MNRKYFNLDENNALFEKLSSNPKWWQIIKADAELYVNVRKDNRINVYYRGASIMSLCCKKGKIEAVIHNYYLGVDKNVADILGVQYGNVAVLSPEQIVCLLGTIKKRVESNKKNRGPLPGDEKGTTIGGKNDYSEKFIQSQMYLKGGYLDTEFALSLDDKTEIRIDLVKITEAGGVLFEELKLIDDSRLRTSGAKPAEILNQMSSYKKFLKEASLQKGTNGVPIIVEYYNKVYRIMDRIGVLPPSLKGVTINHVVDDIQLYVKMNYTKKTPKRTMRIVEIKATCSDMRSNMEDVLEEYNRLPQHK